jgi:hypothetical protein
VNAATLKGLGRVSGESVAVRHGINVTVIRNAVNRLRKEKPPNIAGGLSLVPFQGSGTRFLP